LKIKVIYEIFEISKALERLQTVVSSREGIRRLYPPLS
jgi:hypothetical protein